MLRVCLLINKLSNYSTYMLPDSLNVYMIKIFRPSFIGNIVLISHNIMYISNLGFIHTNVVQWIPVNHTEAYSRVDLSRWFFFLKESHLTKIFTSCLVLFFLLSFNLLSLYCISRICKIKNIKSHYLNIFVWLFCLGNNPSRLVYATIRFGKMLRNLLLVRVKK